MRAANGHQGPRVTQNRKIRKQKTRILDLNRPTPTGTCLQRWLDPKKISSDPVVPHYSNNNQNCRPGSALANLLQFWSWIRRNLKEIGWKSVDWINWLRGQKTAFVNTAKNLGGGGGVPYKARIILTGWTTTSFSGTILRQGVSSRPRRDWLRQYVYVVILFDRRDCPNQWARLMRSNGQHNPQQGTVTTWHSIPMCVRRGHSCMTDFDFVALSEAFWSLTFQETTGSYKYLLHWLCQIIKSNIRLSLTQY